MIMSSVLHMDENTPHMQLMVLHREEKMIEEKTENQEIDMLKINNAMKKQFSRLNQKNENLEPK
ncbi:plasmid recombination protein, partial [Streptobacillus moniliformis]